MSAGQGYMFGGEEMPLFSGTAIRGESTPFRPQTAARQGQLPGTCAMCSDTGKHGAMAYCTCPIGHRALIRDEVLSLSCGTLATLTDLSLYNDLTLFRAGWVEWLMTQPFPVILTWDTWMDCWDAYEEARVL